ncbi:hypothetical protein E2C01_090823 [Portunus trituberculatus]|uniref:Uncharacterized protein n=1 Tax=Portunus trituberculatus TaxID=210409 RepID=A0A5B7JLX3_PORTR|nr:hypothetical protein [Portunus trituberculatus]
MSQEGPHLENVPSSSSSSSSCSRQLVAGRVLLLSSFRGNIDHGLIEVFLSLFIVHLSTPVFRLVSDGQVRGKPLIALLFSPSYRVSRCRGPDSSIIRTHKHYTVVLITDFRCSPPPSTDSHHSPLLAPAHLTEMLKVLGSQCEFFYLLCVCVCVCACVGVLR